MAHGATPAAAAVCAAAAAVLCACVLAVAVIRDGWSPRVQHDTRRRLCMNDASFRSLHDIGIYFLLSHACTDQHGSLETHSPADANSTGAEGHWGVRILSLLEQTGSLQPDKLMDEAGGCGAGNYFMSKVDRRVNRLTRAMISAMEVDCGDMSDWSIGYAYFYDLATSSGCAVGLLTTQPVLKEK
ncbi:hypothetical protein DFP73DRAFT_608376 [Morchella snyderi]|nr:hypothetical protein DFP73DRAFT_608376 [Morchella snyderi]